MKITYEIRQQARTVQRRWLETVYTGAVERISRNEYKRLVAEYQDEYFELVKVTHDEDCLEFTPMKAGEMK